MGACLEVRNGPHRMFIFLLHFLVNSALSDRQVSVVASRGSGINRNNSSRILFAPRLEYDEWTPLGHGDPLKNDPTYDYVPPVLERVKYWLEPPSARPAPTLPPTTSSQYYPSTITIDSRKDTYPFITLVDAPKFQRKTPPHTSTQYLPQPNYSPPSQPYRTITPPPPPPPLSEILTPVPTSTIPPPPTTQPSHLTTDPLFAHYKQPSEPLKGPMYLIIEGHSKVKKYGASNKVHNVHNKPRFRRRIRKRRRRSIKIL